MSVNGERLEKWMYPTLQGMDDSFRNICGEVNSLLEC
jgi:hypothetical protein